MNITLNPIELLHIYRTLLRHPLEDERQNQVLIDKLQRPIVDSLEKEHVRSNEDMYKTWEGKEKKKIECHADSLNDVRISCEKSMKRTMHNIR